MKFFQNKLLYMFILNVCLILIVTAIGSFLLNKLFENWWISIPATLGLQVLMHYFINEYLQTQKIQKSLKKYDSLEYKKYLIDLPCAHCFHINPVLMDFETGSFDCIKCKNKNKLHINIGTVIPTDLDLLTDEIALDKKIKE